MRPITYLLGPSGLLVIREPFIDQGTQQAIHSPSILFPVPVLASTPCVLPLPNNWGGRVTVPVL